MKKNDYTSPQMDCRNLDIEGVICGSGDPEADVLNFDLPSYAPSEGRW